MLIKDEDDDSEHKIVLLGDSRVGKTSLLSNQMYGHHPPTQNPTIGCHCNEVSILVDGKPIVLQVWDTAGQEMYRALVPVYVRFARAAIVVYDITDPKSFASLSRWCELVQDNVATTIPIFLVGNKTDLAEEQQLVDDELAVNFAETHNARFFKTSALTGDGVGILFNAVAREMAARLRTECIRKTDGRNITGDNSTCC